MCSWKCSWFGEKCLWAHQECGEWDYGIPSSWNFKTEFPGSSQHIETAEINVQKLKIKQGGDFLLLNGNKVKKWHWYGPVWTTHYSQVGSFWCQMINGSGDDELFGRDYSIISAHRGRLSAQNLGETKDVWEFSQLHARMGADVLCCSLPVAFQLRLEASIFLLLQCIMWRLKATTCMPCPPSHPQTGWLLWLRVREKSQVELICS